MKILFVFVSGLLAVALSLLATIITTGIIPFKEAAPSPLAMAATSPSESSSRTRVSIFSGEGRVVDELAQTLKEQIEKNKARAEKLQSEEEALALKISQMTDLESRLQSLQEEVTRSIVQISENEDANFKKLAEMYAKMEPESASSLLQKAPPERAAKIMRLIPDRQAAAILNAAVTGGQSGVDQAAGWVEAMRRMNSDKKAQS